MDAIEATRVCEHNGEAARACEHNIEATHVFERDGKATQDHKHDDDVARVCRCGSNHNMQRLRRWLFPDDN